MPRNAAISRFVFLFASLILAIPSGQGQVVSLKAGDSFTHQFTELTQFAESSSGEVVAQGAVEIQLSGDLFDGPDEIRVDMFADQVDGASVGTRTYKAGAVGSKRLNLAISGAWKNLKGAFRVTLTKGSISLTNVAVTVVSVANFPPRALYFGKEIPLTELFPLALKSRLIAPFIELSWPDFYSNCVLEAKSSFEPDSAWMEIGNPAVASDGKFKATNGISELTRFYRLRSN